MIDQQAIAAAIESLKMMRELMLFDPSTGEDIRVESLNKDNKDLYDAAHTAIACMRECAERREGCEWCKAVIVNPCKTCDAQSIGGNACGEYMSCGSYYRYCKSTERQSKKYCDNCGRKLGRSDT